MDIDNNTLDMLVARLDRIEHKVDKLMAFRSYAMGISAICGLVGARLFYLLRGY